MLQAFKLAFCAVVARRRMLGDSAPIDWLLRTMSLDAMVTGLTRTLGPSRADLCTTQRGRRSCLARRGTP